MIYIYIFLCFSILVAYFIQVSYNLKLILYAAKIELKITWLNSSV